MTYSKTQEQLAIKLSIDVKNECQSRIAKIETELVNQYQNEPNPEAAALNNLVKNPVDLDTLLNLQRINDLSTVWLTHLDTTSIDRFLEDEPDNLIDNFLNNATTNYVINFFMTEYVLNDFQLFHEFNQKDAFKNDKQFKLEYRKFIESVPTQQPAPKP